MQYAEIHTVDFMLKIADIETGLLGLQGHLIDIFQECFTHSSRKFEK